MGRLFRRSGILSMPNGVLPLFEHAIYSRIIVKLDQEKADTAWAKYSRSHKFYSTNKSCMTPVEHGITLVNIVNKVLCNEVYSFFVFMFVL